VVPVLNGTVVTHGVTALHACGHHVTRHLIKLLPQVGTSTVDTRSVAADIKKACCYVAQDLEHERRTLSGAARDETRDHTRDHPREERTREQTRDHAIPASIDQTFQLPGGSSVIIKAERFEAPEVLFEPTLLDAGAGPGMHYQVWNAVQQCDEAIRSQLLANVVLCGGCAKLPGLASRLRLELLRLLVPVGMDGAEGTNLDRKAGKAVTPEEMGVASHPAPTPQISVRVLQYKHDAWSAVSALGSVVDFGSFGEKWVTREEFERESAAAR